MTPECIQALTLRLAGAKSSIKKLPKIIEQISPDHRLREQYRFYGAHTGRWSGKGAQLQNLKAARTKDEKKMVGEVIAALEAGQPVENLDALSLSLRPLITAPKGKKVVIADFKSVENRVLMWTSGCEAGMQVYLDGKDPYIDFASRMEDIPYEEVSAEMRQRAKPGTLGCGFGLGGGQLVRKCRCNGSLFDKNACRYFWVVKAEVTGPLTCPKCGREGISPGLPEKTGLWRYAEMMGVDLSQKDAQRQVEEFRQAFSEIAEFWYFLEEAFAACVLTRREQRVNSSLGSKITFRYKDPALRIVLPSGRELVYPSPFAHKGRNARGFQSLSIGFEGLKGKSWVRQTTYGGKVCENVVQAIALDLLVDALFRIEADTRFEIVGHTHDEAICLADENDTGAKERLEGYMSAVEPWACGLPMAADGFEGRRYVKG